MSKRLAILRENCLLDGRNLKADSIRPAALHFINCSENWTIYAYVWIHFCNTFDLKSHSLNTVVMFPALSHLPIQWKSGIIGTCDVGFWLTPKTVLQWIFIDTSISSNQFELAAFKDRHYVLVCWFSFFVSFFFTFSRQPKIGQHISAAFWVFEIIPVNLTREWSQNRKR